MELTRYKDNVQIIRKLAKYIDENPQERFIQALWNVGLINNLPQNDINNIPVIEDRYHEEPHTTLERMRK